MTFFYHQLTFFYFWENIFINRGKSGDTKSGDTILNSREIGIVSPDLPDLI